MGSAVKSWRLRRNSRAKFYHISFIPVLVSFSLQINDLRGANLYKSYYLELIGPLADIDNEQACKMLSQLTFGVVDHRLTDGPVSLT